MNELVNPLRDLDLNLLHTFRAFVVAGSVDRAARALGRSQPAISTRLRHLERELGMKLFERVGRRLHLTAAGRELDRELALLFVGLVRVVDLVRAAPGPRQYRIGALPTVGVYLVAPALAWVRGRHPHARFDVQMGPVPDQLHDLAAGSIDAVAGVGRPPSTGAVVTTLGDARPVLVARAADPLLRGSAVPARALIDRDLLVFGRTGDDFFDFVADWIDRHALARRVVIEVAHIQMLKALVLSGAGVAILPSYTIVEPGLGVRPLRGLAARHPIWFATRPALAEDAILGAVAKRATRHVK